MNAMPININPVNAAQPQSAAGKQQDSAASDVPFSQVLSGEMAQNRRNSETRQSADTGKDAAAQAGHPTEPGERAAAQATEAAEPVRDPLALPLAENVTIDPASILGLAMPPDQPKPAPAKTATVDAERPTAGDANTLLFQNAGKDQPLRTAKVVQLAENARDTQKVDPSPSGKASLQAAAMAAMASPQASTTAAMASAFSGQLAAARQGDAMKGEFMSDLMSNPAMRPASQASFETLHTLNEVASPKLAPTLGTTAWNQALGEKVVWMAAGAQQTATLTLNPPNMGPLQIVLNLTNDQATASFFSAQPEVRQALEAAFPRLKEMMNEAGIQLEQATVSADTPRQENPSDQQAKRVAPPFGGRDDGASAGMQTLHLPAQQSGRGLIDTFA
ncbi:MAG: flagellar hook-length control protein FliK [Thiobacillus sp.]